MQKILKVIMLLIVLLSAIRNSQGIENNPALPSENQGRDAPRLYQKGRFQSNSADILEKIEVKWTYDSRSSIPGGGALGLNGLIYLNSRSDFIALDQAGNEEFSIYNNYYYINFEYAAPSIGNSGKVYLLPNWVRLQAFSTNGLHEWELSIPYANKPPALDNNETLYIGGGFEVTLDEVIKNKMLTQISASGEIIQERELRYPVVRTPALGQNDRIYCIQQWRYSSDYHTLCCLSPNEENWTVFLDGACQYMALDDAGNIYLAFQNSYKELNYLLAFGSDGILKWRFPAKISTPPVIGIDGTIYFGAEKKFMAVNPDGTLKWESQWSSGWFNPPTIGVDNMIYAGSWEKQLYAIRPDGTLAWQFEANEGIEGAPIIAPDGLLVICAGKTVYGIQSTSKGLARSAWPTMGHDNQRTYNSNYPIPNSEIDKIEPNINIPGSPDLKPFYPNPSTGILNLTLQAETMGEIEIVLHNILGQKIRILNQMHLSKSQNINLKYDFMDLPNGIYFISAKQNGKIQTRKFLLMKE